MAGRPTTFKKEYIDKAREYLKQSKDELDVILKDETIIEKESNGSIYKETKKTKVGVNNVKLPSIEGLCKYIGVSRSSVYDWKEREPLFSDILEEILEEQADRLINMGLAGRYNGTITKLLLTKHGYVDKSEITGEDGKDLVPGTVQFIKPTE